MSDLLDETVVETAPLEKAKLQLADYENQVLLGDCLDVLRQIPSESFDSCVTDPPYGLGKEPTIEEIIAYLQGADLETKDFMGKDWNIPSVLVWREVYRVLKPGGFVLSFGGTRTWDLISLGLRAAGFENRDTIAHNYASQSSAGLQWVTSQGMPKSRDPFRSGVLPEIERQLRLQGIEGNIKWL